MIRLPAALMALACLLLSGCDTQQNAVVGGALTYAEQSVAGQVGLIQRANVDAVAAWRVAACAIPLGGAAGTTDTTALKALLTACPIPGVGMVTVNENGVVSVAMGAPNAALPVSPAPTTSLPAQVTSPIAIPPQAPAAAPAAARVKARRAPATQSAVWTPIPTTPDITGSLQTAQIPSSSAIQPQAVPLIAPAQPAPAAAAPASAEPTGGAIP